jgi:hypothetical protein
MTNPSPENAPEITMFFSIGIIGMDEHVTEYITVPLVDTEGNPALAQQLAIRGQLAQLKLQVGFMELMATQFPAWAQKKFEEEGWELPDNLLE